jgi:drug/metabolite transporter (DMT)-like permease/quercetin dioxygenase-like cupin family protein
MKIPANAISQLKPICSTRSIVSRARLARFICPTLFVLLYGTGFVGAKYGLPYCPPFTFLALRFVVAAALAALIALGLHAPWPGSLREALHISVAGLLTVGAFSAGVFVSIYMGVPPALSALIIALQPIAVAILACGTVQERISGLRWLGLGLGFLGVAFVVGNRIDFNSSHPTGVAMSVLGLVGLTAGTLYQKRFCARMNVLTGGAIQSGASALAMVLLALTSERSAIQWSWPFIAALLYMAVGVSMGALTVLYTMIRYGEVSRVASVFYLVPVSATLSAFVAFGERPDYTMLVGIGIVGLGVTLVHSVSAKARRSHAGPPAKIQWSGDLDSSVEWTTHGTQGRHGAMIHEIYRHGEPPRRVALVRFTPGSSAPSHRHTGYETILILSGAYTDDFGEHRQGELVVYPPGSEHGWRSSVGATLFVVWDAPTELIEK